MSTSIYNSPSGTSNILAFNSPGGTQNSFMAPSVSGAVLAYSYFYSANNITPSAITSDLGGNVYVGGTLGTLGGAPTFPNSLLPVPSPYYSFFSAAGIGYIIKYNKFGKIVGLLQISGNVNQIVTDKNSNVYIAATNSGLAFTIGLVLNPTFPQTGTRISGINNTLLKFSPSGISTGYGGGGWTGTTGLAVDAGSNVFVIGTRNTAAGRLNIYNLDNAFTIGGSIPSGAGNYLIKYSPSGIYQGYSLIKQSAGAGGFNGLFSDTLGNMYASGSFTSNLYANVNSIATSDPTSNIYSLNRTATPPTSATGSNAFVVVFGPTNSVASFVEIGNSQAVSGSRLISPSGLGFTSSGSFYVQVTYSTNSGGITTPLFNFGLADPKTGSFLTASGVSVPSVSDPTGSPIMIKYNSSGVPQTVNLYDFQASGKAVSIDKNDAVYQLFSTSTTLSSFTLVNLDNTSTSISVPAVDGTNYTLVKYVSSGNATGFSPVSNVNTTNGTLYSDNRGVYASWRFTNIQSNVNAISTIVSPYATLPSITPATQGSAFALWSL